MRFHRKSIIKKKKRKTKNPVVHLETSPYFKKEKKKRTIRDTKTLEVIKKRKVYRYEAPSIKQKSPARAKKKQQPDKAARKKSDSTTFMDTYLFLVLPQI